VQLSWVCHLQCSALLHFHTSDSYRDFVFTALPTDHIIYYWVSVDTNNQRGKTDNNSWSVRRLEASPTPPCGIFNLNNQQQAGHSHHFVVALPCLVLSCCPIRVSKGEQRRLNPLSNCDSSDKVLKSSKEVGLANSEKKLQSYQVSYIFEILSANVT